MTNSILKPQNRLNIENRAQQNALNGLVGLVNRSIRKMDKRHTQLQQIANEHFDVIIRMEAEEHIKKQVKMIAIAEELALRIFKSLAKSENYKNITQELIHQYVDELDILNFMDFEVTKKYFSFINDHYQPQVIQMKPMIAA